VINGKEPDHKGCEVHQGEKRQNKKTFTTDGTESTEFFVVKYFGKAHGIRHSHILKFIRKGKITALNTPTEGLP
jgi:hypothetical protein